MVRGKTRYQEHEVTEVLHHSILCTLGVFVVNTSFKQFSAPCRPSHRSILDRAASNSQAQSTAGPLAIPRQGPGVPAILQALVHRRLGARDTMLRTDPSLQFPPPKGPRPAVQGVDHACSHVAR